MKAKFIGDPRNPGESRNLPETHVAFGITFERGKFADVPPALENKFLGNTHFEVKEGAAAKADPEDDGKESVAELKERIASVDDVAALKAELAAETRSTAKKALDDRIADLEDA